MLSRDHYAVLGVPPDAEAEAIEAAYRRLSRRYHPQLNPGDARAHAAFERIRLAYSVLADVDERQRYDREGQPGGDRPGIVGNASPTAAYRSESESFQELFRQLCEHARRTRPQDGGDIHTTLSCRLADAERGRLKTVELRRLDRCPHCGGRGRVKMQHAVVCSTCRGAGKEIFGRGTLSVAAACADCGGEGVHAGTACKECRGAGLAGAHETVAVQIPPGVLDGQEICFAGQGHRGLRGGRQGNLVVTVRVEADPRFERQGPHLLTHVPVSVSEAVLGARVRVPTLCDGPVAVRIPPGVQAGQRLRVRGKGLEMANGRRGDLFVVVDIWIPEVFDEDAKRLIREFGERTSGPVRSHNERATVQR